MIGNTPSIPFSTLDVECVCMLNDWINGNDDFCADNYNYSRFMLKDKCRSEKWELYLYGDMTIKVMESRRAEHCGVLRSCSSWCDGKAFFGPCTQVHGQGSPAIWAGKGWRGRRELAPRCSATRITCITRTRLDRHAVTLSYSYHALHCTMCVSCHVCVCLCSLWRCGLVSACE